MKLKEIRLENFRCYKDLVIPLNDSLTVLVASNGQGKTAILDAISIALRTYLRGFDLANNSNKRSDTITVDDIRIVLDRHHLTMVRQLPTRITAVDHRDQKWVRYREVENQDEFDDEKYTLEDEGAKVVYQQSEKIQQKIRDVTSQTISLPVILYYGVNRGVGREKTFARSEFSLTNMGWDFDVTDNDRKIRTFAYHKCLDSQSDYRDFQRWFRRLSNVIVHQSLVKMRSLLGENVKNNVKNIDVEEFKNYIEASEAPFRAIASPVNKVLERVNWKNPRSMILDNIVLEHEQYGTLKLSQLSDGIRSVFSIVADIAYRCYLLNPHLGEDAAKETEGIVLIDEVDMHLHPEWQQVILRDLQAAFPNLQFIVTTHSPQVLSTVKKECIRIINNSKLEEVMSNTYGEVSSDVMYRVQGVNPRPPIAERDDLNKLDRLVSEGRYDENDAQELLEQLTEKLGSGNEAIIRIKRSIERQKIMADLRKGITE